MLCSREGNCRPDEKVMAANCQVDDLVICRTLQIFEYKKGKKVKFSHTRHQAV